MKFTTGTLGEICDKGGGEVRTGPFGSQLHESDYVDDGIPVVMPKNISAGKVSTLGIARVPESDAKRLRQHRLAVGDLVYGRRGDIGRHAFVSAREVGWLCGTGCLRISLGSTSDVLPRYLHYYLDVPATVGWIRNQAIGATMPNLNTSILRRVPVSYPSLPTQRKIAAILSGYDDLIENNLRRMRLLEEMAQALYREWFVEFRFPGHKRVRFIDSPQGRIPEGWKLTKVTNAIDVNPSVSMPTKGEKPFVPMSSLSETSMRIVQVEIREGKSGSKFQNGDTLFARITPCLENGKTGFVQFLSSPDDVAIGSTEFIVLRSRTLSPEIVYLLARSEPFRQNAIKSMSGATGRQRVQEKCFEAFSLAHPDPKLVERFTNIAQPIFEAVHLHATRNDRLRVCRELLLRRLISGELDVSDLAIAVREDAA